MPTEPSDLLYPALVEQLPVEWLRYFLVLAETGHIGQAASRLNITQQALSKALQRMEQLLKVSLFDRKARYLTAAGELLRERALLIVQSYQELGDAFAHLKSSEPAGELKVAWADFWGVHLLPELLGEFCRAYPAVFPRVFMLPQDRLEQALLQGTADLGLMISAPREPKLACLKGPNMPYLVVGHPALAPDWQELGFIVPGWLHGTSLGLDYWKDDLFPRRVVAEVDSLYTALALAEQGLGALFLPEIVVSDRIRRGSLSVLDQAPFELQHSLYLAWRQNKLLPPAARGFYQHLAAWLQPLLYPLPQGTL